MVEEEKEDLNDKFANRLNRTHKKMEKSQQSIIIAKKAIGLIVDEYDNANLNYRNFASFHEGFAILKEEVDELWTEVKASKGNGKQSQNMDEMLKEATQVGAMAMRFIVDLILGDDLFA